MENEGQVLFAVDLHKPDVQLRPEKKRGLTAQQIQQRTEYKRARVIQQERELRASIVRGYRLGQIDSALRKLLDEIRIQWETVHPTVDIAALCEQLASNNVSWIEGREDLQLDKLLRWLDAELLALLEETNSLEATPELLQSLLQNSLAFLQAGKVVHADQRVSDLAAMLSARASYVIHRAANPATRRRCYKLGLPIDDCMQIDEQKHELLSMLLEAEEFGAWDGVLRCEYLVRLADFLRQVSAFKPKESIPDECCREILRQWLQGRNPSDMIGSPILVEAKITPAQVSIYIDDFCTYKLPWGLNALSVYVSDLGEEREVGIPKIVDVFSTLVKYGVYSPVASVLLAFGMTSRRLALKLADIQGQDNSKILDSVEWFLGLNAFSFGIEHGWSDEQCKALNNEQKHVRQLQAGTIRQRVMQKVVIYLSYSSAFGELKPGDLLTIRFATQDEPEVFSLYTLWGVSLGRFRLNRSLPSEWRSPDSLEIEVEDVQPADDSQMRLTIWLREI